MPGVRGGGTGDARFTVWCAACEWNVDPVGPDEEPERWVERQRRSLARRHSERLLAEVTAGAPLKARRDLASVLAQSIALLVHGVPLGAGAAGVWLLVGAEGTPATVLGALLLGVAVVLRPRLGGLPDDAPVLRREDVPALFALVDEVAETAGTRGVDRIAVDGESNASVFSYGLLGRRVLTIGLPLWTSAMRRARLSG